MGLANTTAPKTNQQNFDDYIAGPKTVTVAKTKEVGGEQPYEVHLVEFPGKPYKPSKGMRRVLLKAWGDDGDDPVKFAGRRITLYGDPEVMNMGERVGGLRISHLSHISEPLLFSITEKRGVRKPFTVQPLREAPAAPPVDHLAVIRSAPDLPALKTAWENAKQAGMNGADGLTNARKKELEGGGA